MYDIETRNKICEMFGNLSMKEISDKTGVSVATLYKWKKEYEIINEKVELIRHYRKTKEYEKAIEVGRLFPNNELIQSQIIKIYIINKQYKEAIDIGLKFPDCEIIQIQMIKIYIITEEYEKALEIGGRFLNSQSIQDHIMNLCNKEYSKIIQVSEKFPNDELIQSQIIRIYSTRNKYKKAFEIGEKFPNSKVIQNQICEIQKLISRMRMFCDCDLSEINELSIIRQKLISGKVSSKEIELLSGIKNRISNNIYNLVLAAIYERIGLKNKCIELLRTLEIRNEKIIKKLIKDVNRQKNREYNIEKWDIMIGWSTDEVFQIEEKSTVCNLRKSTVISGTMGKQSKTTKTITKEAIINHSEPTIYESLDKKYKEMVFKLKLQYYREMYDIDTRRDATFKYDKLEETLSQKASNKNAFMNLLLMLIGSFEEVIEYDYNDEYKILKEKINKKKRIS